MSSADLDELIAALDLPAGSRVDQRVPKKLLLEHGAPTASDRRHINEGIEELLWLAALKPTTIGVPEFRDETHEYLEIAVLRLTLRPEAKAARLLELVHRAVPYPLLLLAESGSAAGISVAHKRWAQNEAGKTVLDGDPVAAEWEAGGRAPGYWTAFRDALALGRQPRSTLHTLYQGWADTLLAFKAAQVTGSYRPVDNPEQAATRHEALKECARLDAEIAGLRAAATKERQIARKVELNLELKRVESRLAAARQRL
jgi:hypothetical protein